MPDKHLSSQFDSDLTQICAQVMAMGGLVETQIMHAMQAVNEFDLAAAAAVIDNEARVNLYEIEIDEACSNIIALRQPAARDLRLLMAISKMIANLERAGDEVMKIGRRIKAIIEAGNGRLLNTAEIRHSGQLAASILRNALDAFARLDIAAAVQILHDDRAIDDEFDAFVRKLVTYMMENPRTIGVGLDYLFIAKAIERIGDHAKNIAEFVIYIVKGTDVRHLPSESLERAALG
ncbi:phosphate signaling complex protein PhoU [Chitinasiproducens palmae]|uniref:Phosphate-specific transport system accessory protein PhoU n=1 Tax=Chitinasiproducens palmae TaxID=1770053 RepID=A0A1H2PUY8_9BURK|nr:phosphate signaling complex protein PhoU [Chitinasiproducens palmae]SDV51033.1 phosphate uptake regulator, PhoU [Chitinasiproducens palmae]